MAARRLLILMLVLLAVSTLAAALVPPQAQRDETTSDTETATKSGRARKDRTPPGRLVERTIHVSPQKPATIHLRRGDQLALTVRSGSKAGDHVEIPAFGLIEDLSLTDPARFDLLLERAGVFRVRLLEAKRVIGRIAVGRAAEHGK